MSLTMDKLRRGKIFVNACYFCKRAEENCNHALLWCLVVYKLWTMVYGLLDISWVMAVSMRDEIWALRGISVMGKQADLIQLTIF